MDHCMDTTFLFSPAIPITAQWPHKQSDYGGRNRDYAWAHQHGFPFTRISLATSSVECPFCLQQTPMLYPQYGTNHSPRWSTTCLIAGWLQWTASIMEYALFLLKQTLTLGHRFTFSAYNTKTIICGLIECLIHYHGIPRSIDFGQATYFTTVKCGSGLMLIEFTSPDVVSNILKQLTWWNDGMALWRFSYSASWMAVSCKAGERFSRRMCVPWISVRYMVSFLPYPESWVQKLRDRNGSNSTH